MLHGLRLGFLFIRSREKQHITVPKLIEFFNEVSFWFRCTYLCQIYDEHSAFQREVAYKYQYCKYLSLNFWHGSPALVLTVMSLCITHAANIRYGCSRQFGYCLIS